VRMLGERPFKSGTLIIDEMRGIERVAKMEAVVTERDF
jgi:hypothetical protein